MGCILINCIDPMYIVFLTAGIEVKANLLYFSNISNIQYYNKTASSTRVIFDNFRYVESLECNLRDHKIYWIDFPGIIKRGNPNDPTSTETVSTYCIVLWVWANMQHAGKNNLDVLNEITKSKL